MKYLLAAAVRLLHHPVRTASIVVPLAVAVAAATTVYTIIDQVLLRQVAGVSSHVSLVSLRFKYGASGGGPGAWEALPAYRRAASRHGLVALGGSCCKQAIAFSTNSGASGPTLEVGDFVSAEYFEALGVRPLRGRLLTDEEAEQGSERVAVVSELLWRRAFGGTDTAIGQSVSLNGQSFRVVGVAAQFRGWGRSRDGNVDIWLPLTSQLAVTGNTSSMSVAVGQLRQPSALSQVEQDLRTAHLSLGPELSARVRSSEPFLTAGLWPITATQSQTLTIQRLLTVFVLLIGVMACANAANVMLTQLGRRRRLVAIHVALGATRFQVTRLLLAETFWISLAIGCLGAAASGLLLATLTESRLAAQLPSASTLAIDWRILIFACGISLLAVAAANALPLFWALRPDISRDLGDDSRTTSQSRRSQVWLMAVQFAVSVVFVATAGTIGLSLRSLVSTDIGMEPENVIQLSVESRLFGYTVDRSSALVPKVVEALQAHGFAQVATASPAPLDELLTRMRIRTEAMPAEKSMAITDVSVSGDYFGVLGIRLTSGRAIVDDDAAGTDSTVPVVVSENLAVDLFGSASSAVGRSIEFDRTGGSWRTGVIVGVAENVQSGGSRKDAQPAMYHRLPTALGRTDVLVRFSGGRAVTVAGIEEAVRSADPVAPLLRLEFLADVVRRRTSTERLLGTVTLLGAISAVLLSISGVAGVATQLIRDRRREFGIRVALGAAPGVLIRLVLRSVTVPIICGIVGGLGVYAWLSQWLRTYVFGVEALDVTVLAGVSLVVALTAVLAALFPASRAGRISPVTALRSE